MMEKRIESGEIALRRYLTPDEWEIAKRFAADPERRPAEVMAVILPALRSMRQIRLGYRAIWDFIEEELPSLAERYSYASFYAWARRNVEPGKKKIKKEEGGAAAAADASGPPTKRKGPDIFDKIRKKKENE
jgi:hypothetical protein